MLLNICFTRLKFRTIFILIFVFTFSTNLFTQQLRDTYSDTWVATDDLQRVLPTNNEVGDLREYKTLAVFYYLWHEFHTDTTVWGPWDITKLLKENPTDPQYGPSPIFHWWGEPILGYYNNSDKYVYAKHAQMLTDAGVDVWFFDVTNALTYDHALEVLFEVLYEIKSTGRKVPKVSFIANSKSASTVQHLYDFIYSKHKYEDFWYYWDGKPLILTPKDGLSDELLDYFTTRKSWAWNTGPNAPYNWSWLDDYPQDYGWGNDPNSPEQISVATAQHPTGFKGKSFHNDLQPEINEQKITPFTNQGLFFEEQWGRALEVDPPLVFVTQWNEWIAQRFISGTHGSPNFLGEPTVNGETYFVDAYNAEFNRDIEPNRGINKDNYYYQLVSNARKYKGVRPIPKSTSEKSITINNDFSEWENVGPEFRDDINDTRKRDSFGFTSAVKYKNESGRNDFDIVKVARDSSKLYFYAKTVNDITPQTDLNWMILFIDIDSDYSTGWYGYDYLINRTRNGSETSIEKNIGNQWSWENRGNGEFYVNGKQIQLAIDRDLIGIPTSLGSITFDFKWADNIPANPDILDFIDNGDVAPNNRFNYRFIENENEVKPGPFGGTPINIPGILEIENYDEGGQLSAYFDNTSGNSGNVYRNDDVDIGQISGDTNNYFVGWTQSEEWLNYNVDIDSTGLYSLSINASSETAGNLISILIDEKIINSEIMIPKTNGIQNWTDTIIPFVSLKKGLHKFKIIFNTGGVNLNSIDFNYVSPNILPEVRITNPSNNSEFLPKEEIIITADATDEDGSVSKVEFYNNTVLIGESTTEPYSFTWQNVQSGYYSITARAYDNELAYTTSEPIGIIVKTLKIPTWDFINSLDNWELANNLSGGSAQGILKLKVLAGDPHMICNDNLNTEAKLFPYVRIVMKNQTEDNVAKFYFATNASPNMSEDKMVSIPIKSNDSEFSEYIFDMSTNINWTGIIKQVRLDPVENATSGRVEIQQIKFFSDIPISPIAYGTGDGLIGNYYSNTNFEGEPCDIKIDSTINYIWGPSGPSTNCGSLKNNFSISWEGELQPRYSEEYDFYITSNEGAKLWIDDSLIINNWTNPNTIDEVKAKINLSAGEKYKVHLDYYELEGFAQIIFEWNSLHQYRESVSKSQLYNTGIVGINNNPSHTITEYSLEQNYPNPFNPTTTISYSVPKKEKVNLSIYNLLGQKIVTLVDSEILPGRYSTVWKGISENGSSVSSGIYIYSLKSPQYQKSNKLILLK